MVTGISYNPPELLWVITTQTSVLGGSSLRSPYIEDDERTCLTLDIPLPANTIIGFSLRTSSEAVNDFLYFEADGTRLVDNFSATSGSLRNWEPQEVSHPNTIPNMAWCYTKNGSTSRGTDSGWVDALSIAIPLSIDDVCLALDLSTQECALINGVASSPPQLPWLISPIATESSTSLRSADIGDDQQSCLLLNLSLTDRTLVQFSRRVSSEPFGDRLFFAADRPFVDSPTEPHPVTIFSDWSLQRYLVQAETTTLSWCYRKDDETSQDADSVWIDDLSITATTLTALPNLPDLPNRMDDLLPLNVDAETGVTELDLIVALRWLVDQQENTESLVVNLTIPGTDIAADGLENLQQLFTQDIDRIDVNGDGRADQLDLRILLRYLSGLRGAQLTEQETSSDLEGIIQLLLGTP